MSAKYAVSSIPWRDLFLLTRFDRPIGSLLLLWPTIWALLLVSHGSPSFKNLVIFVLGVFLMRSAGCVINDIADRKVDKFVARTENRPLTSGRVTVKQAICLFIVLIFLSFILVLNTNTLTIQLAFIAAGLAFVYPFMKRYTHLPQLVLGAAFSWGIPMAWAAEIGRVDPLAWLVFTVALLWTVAYDTFYAMVDREDDLKVGIKSTAILFGESDRRITSALQILVLIGFLFIGKAFNLATPYYLSIIAAAALFVYQQWLISDRVPVACFKAFLNNNYVGLVVSLGIALSYWISF